MARLAPPPYGHLSRYFGVFASHSRWRRKIILRPDVKRGFVATPNGNTQSCSFQGVPLSGGEVDVIIIDVDPGRTNEVIAEGRCRIGQTCTLGSGAARITVRL